MPIIAYFQIIDGANGICSGVLKGSGLQTVGAIVNIFCLYMLAVPLGICLVYVVNLRLTENKSSTLTEKIRLDFENMYIRTERN
ncbi:unnamed protein product [Schistosoma margrebowiei]|uniref:Uncharacterized protein n=1 Tax=Schistosoma margrebowiei TaxID=48269 RepID=A0A183LGC1_9TREM|nr:unnamed protein product [Schistosoma margrebowiei]